MTKLPNLAGLEGLLDLDRRGVDIRPILLRVITDQYLLSPTHTPDEERQFIELALRLLDETDVATRAQVAARLATHACAPRLIVLQLARDVLDVAEPVLRYSTQLTPADLAAIAAERGPEHAAIIAGRADAEDASAPTPQPARAASPALAHRNFPLLQTNTASGTAKPAVAVPAVPEPAKAEASELCELFFAARPAERRLILINLDYAMWTPADLPLQMQQTDVWRFESAALQRKTDIVVHELEQALGISRRQAHRIIEDETGEPIVAAARAMQLPADVLQRILLFMNPRVGQSVDRVYELAALYGEITVDAALRMIALWRDADPAEAPPARHDVAWQEAVDYARAALASSTRRATATVQREGQAPRPNERAAGSDRG